jgi:hypothetical protein
MTRQWMLVVAFGLGGCTLDPLVEDEPGESVHVLPPGSEVPRIDEDVELVHQISVHDGLDDGDLEEAGFVIARETGWANGVAVNYWAFGNAPRFAGLVYVLVDGGGERIDHPYLFDSIPGDASYSPFRKIQHVVVTDRYDGEVLPTIRALEDAFELGLVEEPVNIGFWIDAPVVPPGVTLDTGRVDPEPPVEAYAAGFRVDYFVFGGERGVQPVRNGGMPAGQASVVREAGQVRFSSEPIFQYGIPAEPAVDGFNWTPLVTMVEVDLAAGVLGDTIAADADLFVRSMTGSVTGMTPAVDRFTVTTTVRNLPVQFEEGWP